MSETLDAPAGSTPPGAPARPAEGAGTWGLTRRGILTVARLELRQRVRSTRWVAVLMIWAAVLGGLAFLIHGAVFSNPPGMIEDGSRDSRAGAAMFGWVVLLVLTLGSLVAPALSATSVNGDRSAGVLATLQATLLTPAEIVVGKLLAAWATGLSLLAVAAPYILWAYLSGGTPGGRLVVVLTLLSIMLLVVCAIGLGWSALTARTASSAVLTYLSVAFLGLGLPLLFGLMLPVVSTEEYQTVRMMESAATPQADDPSPLMRCVEREELRSVTHSERIWWLLAVNPFVVIADASPTPRTGAGGGDDVLSAVRSSVRELRLGPEAAADYCYGQVNEYEAREKQRAADRERLGITWPYGLAADLAIGAGFAVVAVRRLRTPVTRLPRGTRVA